MPVPSTAVDISTTASSNSPAGSDLIGNTLDEYLRATQAIVKQQMSQGADLASASTLALLADGNTFDVTGTTTITGISSAYSWNGRTIILKFDGALTLTHNATTLILPGGANITTSAGDSAIFRQDASGEWRCIFYQYARINFSILQGRNKLINSNFLINQRAVSGSVVLAAGVYGHDRWKAGASGCSYTFASSNGKTTLTISAGSLQQVIASEEVPIGTTTCVLSWEGSAQGKIGAGSYGSSGVTQSVTGGSNLTIEFNTGTLAIPQLEVGNYATAYEQKTYSEEFDNCWRYFRQYGSSSATVPIGPACGEGTTAVTARMPLSPPMRSTPTPSLASGELIFIRNGVDRTSSTIAFGGETTLGIAMELQSLSGTVTAGEGGTVAVNTNGILRLSAEI